MSPRELGRGTPTLGESAERLSIIALTTRQPEHKNVNKQTITTLSGQVRERDGEVGGGRKWSAREQGSACRGPAQCPTGDDGDGGGDNGEGDNKNINLYQPDEVPSLCFGEVHPQRARGTGGGGLSSPGRGLLSH